MNLLEKLAKLPKRKLVIGLIILAVILVGITILIGAIATGKIKFFAASNPQITNIATATFTDASEAPVTIQSNTVTTEITATNQLIMSLTLQGRSDYSANNINLQIYTPGTTANPVFQKTDIATDASGQATLDVTGLTAGSNYDFYLRIPSYLVAKKLNQAVTSFPLTLAFGQINGGDLNNSGTIDALDYSLWRAQNALADINADGSINGSDFDILIGNWTP